MRAVLVAVLKSLGSVVRSRTALQLEVLALRHQLAIYQQAGHRPTATTSGSSALGVAVAPCGPGGERPW